MGETSAPKPDRTPFYVSLLLCLFVSIAYHNISGGVFLFDDHSGIVRNRTIRSFESALFSDRTAFPTAYQRRPVVNWSYAINYSISGLDPWSYHLFNLLVHAACMLLLFDFLRRTLQLEGIPQNLRNNALALAGTITLLWGTHPLQTQSVTYTTQRCESLMSLCYLLCLYGVLRGSTSSSPTRWYCLVVASFVIGMATKEVMITAPLLVLLFDLIFLSGNWRTFFKARRFLYVGFSIGIVWLAAALLRTNFDRMGREIASGRHATGWEYLLTQPDVLLRYLRLSFWPSDLTLRYEWPVTRQFADAMPAGICVVAMLIATAFLLCRWPRLGFVAASFFVILAPTSSIMPIKHPIFEHRMYLPLASVCVFLVLAVWQLLRHLSEDPANQRRILLAVGLLAAVALTIRTIDRNYDYHSEAGMWTDCLKNSPDNTWALWGVAQGHLDAGEPEQALPLVLRSVELKPNDPDSQVKLGIVLNELGDFADAAECFEKAVQLDSFHAEAHLGLAVALSETDRWELSVEHFETATRLHDEKDRVLNDYAVELSKRGLIGQSEDVLKTALRINPENAEAWNNLGTAVMLRGGHTAAATKCFQAAVFYDPGFELARLNLNRVSTLASPP
ncbi:MAG: tetratricopeptide repeat protein [Planctomycetaceae bacterium]|nr:tetratricopeptide repeat protein [Planctomycetaceae bacterium]